MVGVGKVVVTRLIVWMICAVALMFRVDDLLDELSIRRLSTGLDISTHVIVFVKRALDSQ